MGIVRKFNKNKYAFSKTAGFLSLGEGVDKKRKEQISLFRKEIYLYDVHIKGMTSIKTNYEKRNILLNIAFFIIEEGNLLNSLYKKKKLNINLLSKECMIKKEFIEKYKEYIILYTILFSNPKYKIIQSYFKIIQLVPDGKNTNLVIHEKEESIKKGIVIKVNDRSLNLLTSTGEIIKAKKDKVDIGNEYLIQENEFMKKHKIKLFIGAIAGIIALVIAMQLYNKPVNSITVGTTSLIKLEMNTFDKVLASASKTEKGKEMLNKISINGDSLDNAVLGIIQHANQNEMIPEKGILVTISGEPINIKRLKKTGEYIYENKINVDINNSGTEHKLYTIIKNQKEEKNE